MWILSKLKKRAQLQKSLMCQVFQIFCMLIFTKKEENFPAVIHIQEFNKIEIIHIFNVKNDSQRQIFRREKDKKDTICVFP